MYLYVFNNNFLSNPNVINAFTIVSKRFLNPLKLLQILKNLITCEPKTPIIELLDTIASLLQVFYLLRTPLKFDMPDLFSINEVF